LSINYSGERFSPEKEPEEPSEKADSPAAKEKVASPSKSRETVIMATANSTQKLFADIEELLGESSSDSSDEDPEKTERERKKIEKELSEGGGSRWYGRSARKSLSFATRSLIEAQADASNCKSYDNLRPKFDHIRERIRLLEEEIQQKMERMWKK
jgi:hypothetical protein